MENNKEERYCITVEEMARRIGLGLTTAYKLARKKEFYPARRIAGRIVVNIDLLKKYLSEAEPSKEGS